MKVKIRWKEGAPKGRVSRHSPDVDFAAEYDREAEYSLETSEAEAVLEAFPERFEIATPSGAKPPKAKTAAKHEKEKKEENE